MKSGAEPAMRSDMPALLVLVALTSFVIYAVAIQRMFLTSGGVDLRMRAIQTLGTVFAFLNLWCLWHVPANPIGQTIGLVLYAAGLASFFAAKRALSGYRLTLAFSADAPQRLIDAGIYSRVRHPFYMAYSLTWLAGAMAAPSVLTTGSALVMIILYVSAARLEEGKFAESELGAAYAAYRTRAGMLWLKLP